MRGKQPGSTQSPTTVRKTLRHVQAVLDKAGPAGPRNRDAANLIPAPVPWIKRPRAAEKTPAILEPAVLRAVYDAAAAMTEPAGAIAPPAWWRGLLVLAHNTLLRRRTLFELQWGDVDWRGACLRLPATRLKSRRPQVVHLNAAAIAALEAMAEPDATWENRPVFAGYREPTAFHDAFRRLQAAAGVPREERFGLHALRANSARLLWESSPQAAQATLGHRSIQTTLKHYVNGGPMAVKALDKLPQPWDV